MLKFAVLFSVVIAAVNSFATTATNVKIVGMMMDKTIQYATYIKVTPALTGQPCSSTAGWHFVLYDDSQHGKNMLSMLLTAQSTGQTLTIKGEGNCFGETEKILNITFTSP
jgi:hypothetical protein